jgi:hypothetical protein
LTFDEKQQEVQGTAKSIQIDLVFGRGDIHLFRFLGAYVFLVASWLKKINVLLLGSGATETLLNLRSRDAIL